MVRAVVRQESSVGTEGDYDSNGESRRVDIPIVFTDSICVVADEYKQVVRALIFSVRRTVRSQPYGQSLNVPTRNYKTTILMSRSRAWG